MFTNKEIQAIKEKMAKTHTYYATFGRQLNISRQAVSLVLNNHASSKRIEEYVRKWLLDKSIKEGWWANESKNNK